MNLMPNSSSVSRWGPSNNSRLAQIEDVRLISFVNHKETKGDSESGLDPERVQDEVNQGQLYQEAEGR